MTGTWVNLGVAVLVVLIGSLAVMMVVFQVWRRIPNTEMTTKSVSQGSQQ